MFALYLSEFVLRPNSSDYLQIRSDDGILMKFTSDMNLVSMYLNNWVTTSDVIYIDFVSTGPTSDDSAMATWWIDIEANYKSCDCFPPSVTFINDNETVQGYNFASYDCPSADDYCSVGYYCPGMSCTWEFVNGYYGVNSVEVAPYFMSLRNTTDDYIEGHSSKGLLFRLLNYTSFKCIDTSADE
uniref:Uncharacterized protein n=1 Tax=Acrobeloides nanus TaxID=290746 RepID=A0A914EJW4_9BILA